MQNSLQPDTRPITTSNGISFNWIIVTRHIHLAKFWLSCVLLFVIPPIIMWYTNMPETNKYLVATIMVTLSVIYSLLKRKKLHELGIRKDTFKKSLVYNGMLTLSLSIVIYLAYINNLYRPSSLPEWANIEAFLFYFFVSSPAQEFLYRSFLFSEMNLAKINNIWAQIFISSFTFSFFHIHHKDFFILGITFFVGIVWSVIYQKYPNLISVSISHSILGIIAVMTRLI
jgi:uncharacterized protein